PAPRGRRRRRRALMAQARYRFAPGLELALDGPAGALRHFAREYGPAAIAPSAEPPALRATIAWGADGADDGHKTVSWRVRLGPDLRQTAPAAFRRLPRADRGALLARSAARALSRGWVAPSLAVHASTVGPAAPKGPLPVRRLVVVERAAGLDASAAGPLELETAIELALDVLDE